MTKDSVDRAMSTTYLMFMRKHNKKPNIIILSKDMLDLLLDKESQTKIKNITFFEAKVVVDPELPEKTVRAEWMN